jgi:hypothetical protein
MKLNEEFDLEKKARKFLTEFYKEKGAYEIIEAPYQPFDDWDRTVKFKNITYKIEEKARIGIWDDILIELLEDVTTGDLGWYYQTKADKLIYCMFLDRDKEIPSRVYSIALLDIKKYISENSSVFEHPKLSYKGYGLTLNIFVPLDIAQQIYP